MPDHRSIRWLHAQLPALVEKGVLTRESADALRAHFVQEEGSSGAGIIISAVLGATLIGAGIILVLAHNWDELGKSARTVISFAPLLAAIALSAFAMLRRASSAAWCEGAAIFQSLAVAAAIGLVGQTWHIAGDFFDFLLTWMLLCIPLVYLLRATSPAAFYIVGIASWAAGITSRDESALWAWPLLALVVPFYGSVVWEKRHGHRANALSLLLALAVPVIFSCTLEHAARTSWIPACAGLFAALYLAGVRWFENDDHHAHAFRTIGALGLAALAITLSYRGPWLIHDYGRASDWRLERIIGIGLPVLAVFFGWLCFTAKRDPNTLSAALPVAALGGWLCARSSDAQVGLAMFFNGYALALGVVTLIRGVRRRRIGGANAGMLLIAALVSSRFFDGDSSFVARGAAFIVIGIGFLLANFYLFKRRQKAS
ncbi:MAG: hypothetical protein QOD99_1336 [Chthoniobacter sp.]|nr:hypothetical protein [Chthoniobacter sp.]